MTKDTKARTEDALERRVEREMDALDRAYMRGDISKAEYDWQVKALDAWAEIVRSRP
jgi:hypothetical protein